MVNISERYICRGSDIFSPILKGGVGVTGVKIRSTSLKADKKSCIMRVLTFDAFR
jgi:hypothetical protein